MARFKSIVTDAGAAALTALIAAGKPLILTRAAAGSGVATVSPNTLADLVTPENVAVSLGEKDLIEGDPAIMRIPVQVTNEALDAPVWIREVAVYGNTIDNTEVMFCYGWLDGDDSDNVLPATSLRGRRRHRPYPRPGRLRDEPGSRIRVRTGGPWFLCHP